MQDKDIIQIKQLIESAYLSLKDARDLLERSGLPGSFAQPLHRAAAGLAPITETVEGNVVQGIFDGQEMRSLEGKRYPVPANYASKSKLVSGDQLKLTIKHDGAFQFKQVGPVERKRLKGTLFRDEHTEQYRVVAEGMSYKVLTASITYFKGEPGDEVIILVPQHSVSEWGAVEHVMKIPQTVNPTFSHSVPDSQKSVDSPEVLGNSDRGVSSQNSGEPEISPKKAEESSYSDPLEDIGDKDFEARV